MDKENSSIKNNWIKKIRVLIVTLFVGAIGSGVWEYVLKPVVINSSNLILNIITFGLNNFKDSVYVEISKGFHNSESLQLYGSFISVTCGIFLGMSIPLAKELDSKIKKANEKVNEKTYERKDKTFKFTLWFIMLFFVPYMFFTILRVSYINTAITEYKQLYTTCLPYTDEKNMKIINSNFSQIQNREDYLLLMKELQEIAEDNNLKYKKYKKD